MLSIKDSYAFYQTSFCLLSNVNMIAIKYNPIFRAHPINIGEYWLQPVREDFPFVSYYVAHRYHREYGFLSPVGSLACVSCLKFNLHSVDSSHSCSFKHKLLIFLRTRIIQMTRMSPVGSLACVSCLLFNQYSVDSTHYFPLVSGSTTNLVFL